MSFGSKCAFLPEDEQDKSLRWPNSKLRVELPGILNWALEGLKRLRERGYFLVPDEMQSAIDEYQRENSSVRLFADAQCVLEVNGEVPVGELYELYKSFCQESNLRPLSKINFGKELKDAFPTITQSVSSGGKSRMWDGICLSTVTL